MIALKIEDIKLFMNKLLKTEVFDEFEVISIELTTISKFSIDGNINQSYFSTDDKELLDSRKYVQWIEIKDIILNTIKGSKQPTNIKIIFSLSDKSKSSIIEKASSSLEEKDINGFYLNILFENNILKAITGTNYGLFTLDKSIENYYDTSIQKFFKNHQIDTILL